MTSDIVWTFGELEAVLASVHGIDQTKRTAFQSRLKNFHRLAYPLGFNAVKGKAATYTPLQIVDMALAVEMTQLGLPPERATWVLIRNRWPILMAFELASRELRDDPARFNTDEGLSKAAMSIFLYFDPAALHPLTLHLPAKTQPDLDQAANSFFYGGLGIVRDGVVPWTSGASARLSLINVTAMAGNVAASPFEEGADEDIEYRRRFLSLLERSAAQEREDFGGGDEPEADYVWSLLERDEITDPAVLAELANISVNRAARYIDEFTQRQERHGL